MTELRPKNRSTQQAARRYMKREGINYTTALRVVRNIPWHEPIDCNWQCPFHEKKETS